MGVFGPQRVQRGGAGFLPDAQHVQQARDEAHVTHVQNTLRTNGRKAAHGQFNGLSLGIAALAANELQAHLADLPVFAALRRQTEHVFHIIQLAGNSVRLRMLDDAHGNVRLQSHQPARRIGEGNDPFAFEKVFILPVQVIGFKIAHPVAAVAALLEQSAQKQRHLFVFRQTSRFDLHWRLPPLFCGAGGPVQSRLPLSPSTAAFPAGAAAPFSVIKAV